MKKLPAIIISILIVIVSGLIINFLYQRNTPKPFGQAGFPLTKKWSFCVDGKILEITANEKGMVLVKTSDKLHVYHLDEGNLIWTASIEDQSESFPSVIADDKVFVSDSKQLWGIDLKSGEELWRSSLDSTDTWVPDASNKYVLLNSRSGDIIVYDVESGTELWRKPAGRGYTNAYIDGDMVYVVDRGVKALNAVTGDILWELDRNRATGASAFGNGILYYIEYPGHNTIDLVAYNTSLRAELWRVNLSETIPNELLLHGKFLYMTENEALYQIDSQTGVAKWKKMLSAPANLSFIGNNLYVLERFYRIIRALNIENGSELGSLQIANRRILSTESQEMVSSENSLIFSRGCEIFVYGN